MDDPAYYEIRLKGQLSQSWADWFDGLTLLPAGEDETILRGWLADQAELIGVVNRLQALNLMVISINRTSQSDEPL